MKISTAVYFPLNLRKNTIVRTTLEDQINNQVITKPQSILTPDIRMETPGTEIIQIIIMAGTQKLNIIMGIMEIGTIPQMNIIQGLHQWKDAPNVD